MRRGPACPGDAGADSGGHGACPALIGYGCPERNERQCPMLRTALHARSPGRTLARRHALPGLRPALPAAPSASPSRASLLLQQLTEVPTVLGFAQGLSEPL